MFGKMDNMDITIEEVKSFIADSIEAQQSWAKLADKSWYEVKKRRDDLSLVASTANSIKKKARYPVWYSIFKIRQPLWLSRIGIPIGKDSTQDGKDPFGETAAICLERLAKNIAKSFDFFETLCAARDDGIVTNFAQVRAYYNRDLVQEYKKEYLEVTIEDNVPNFVDTNGNIVMDDNIQQDDQGYYIESMEPVDVEREQVFLEPILYKDFLVEPNISRWSQCKRIAFRLHYSEREFIEIFGAQALFTKPTEDNENDKDELNKKKQRNLCVYEYWDFYSKKVLWLLKDGTDFIYPINYRKLEEEENYREPTNGLYNLEKFFPVPKPFILNTSTDCFWPFTEFLQLEEIVRDIHGIFSRMISVTKAFRARLLFDNTIEGLQEALSEAAEGDAFGITNLSQALTNANGSLANAVQYVPTDPLLTSLNNLYISLEQRLNSLYKLTGTSDLLQGLVTDPTQRTFGERQMLEKYALNQQAEPQRKMQEFVRDCYQLLCEMALKNFKDESLDRYIIPETLDEEHRYRYNAALELLKKDSSRFRIELETDSTISINEEYDKQVRTELVNVLTAALEKTASIAQTAPSLVKVELHCLKYLIQGFRQAKMFQSEITEAIDNIIEETSKASQTNQFNEKEVSAKLKKLEIDSNTILELKKLESSERISEMKIAQENRISSIESQLELIKEGNAKQESAESLKIEYAQLIQDITQFKEEMALKNSELLLELRKADDKKSVDEFKAILDAKIADSDIKFREVEQQLESYLHQMDLAERVATEQRLQSEQKLSEIESNMKILSLANEVKGNIQQAPPNLSFNIENKPSKRKKKYSMKYDEYGNPSEVTTEDVEEEGGV